VTQVLTAPDQAVLETGPPRNAPRLRLLHPLVITPLVYLAGSLALHRRVLGSLSTATTGWTSSDSHLFVWWLNWLPWSLLNGQNPLLTTYQHFPVGVNSMWNTTAPVLAALLSPVTLTAGPVAAYNIGMILGPVVSGLALVLALRPYVHRWFPRAVAGVLYGFSPFIVAHSSVGHLNLVWAVLPPVLLWAVHAVFIRPGSQPWRTGALLGLAFAVQTGIYTQTVAFGAIVLVVVAAVLALRYPHRIARRACSITKAGVACIGLYVVLCAYPLYLLLAGPARPRAPIRDPVESGADAANLLVPTYLSRFQLRRTAGLAEQLNAHAGEQGGYIGLGLLVLLLVAVVTVRRSAVRITAAVGLVLVVLSLGVHLVVLDRNTGVPLPWQILGQVPLVSEAEAVRLQIFIALCVAVIVALWLDHLAEQGPNWWRWTATGATLVAAGTWLPSDAQQAVPATTPAFFVNAADYVPPSAVIETFPRISGRWVGGADPLLWQVVSGMAYRTTGGYFIGSDSTHDLLLEAPVNAYQVGAAEAAVGVSTPTDELAMAAAQEFRARGVTTVVIIDHPGVDFAQLAAWTNRVTGSKGERVADALVFRLVPA
jgi:hypothetical protein